MKANELRIGNYINDEQTTHIIVGVDNYCIKSYWLKDVEKECLYETQLNQIKPIPLTEEWLLKFGFEKDELGWFFKENDYCSFGLFFKDNEWLFYISDTKIKYVHQLQNLYFALTNNELTNKLQM